MQRPNSYYPTSSGYRDFLEANKESILRSAVEAIDPDRMQMERQQALTLAGAMKNCGFSREDFADVMRKSQYDKGTFADQWDSFRGEGANGECTEGTIFHYAKLCGWTWPAPSRESHQIPAEKQKRQELALITWDDSFTISCLMDSVEYKDKPVSGGAIRSREQIPTPPPTKFTVEEFALRVTHGCSFYPTVYSKEPIGITDKGKEKHKYNAISQQLFVVDVDNDEEYTAENGEKHKRRIQDPLTIERALKICKGVGIYPFLVYETFSSKVHRDDPDEPYIKYRLCFALNEPVTVQEVGERGITAITNFFIKLFAPAADPKPKDFSRIIYGTNEPDRVQIFHRFLDKKKLLSLIFESREGTANEKATDPKASLGEEDHGFYRVNKYGEISGVIDSAVVEYMKKNTAMFIFNDMLYIYDHGVYSMDEKGNRFKTMVSQLLYSEFVTASRLENIYKLLKTDVHLELKEKDLNKHPHYVINVKNGMLNLKTLELKDHDPSYHSINQIPHEYIPGFNYDGTITEEFLTGFLTDHDDLFMFLEYAGYCMTKDTRQQVFLIIKGPGGIGKSELIHLVEEAVGSENIASLSIQNVNDRFSPAFLVGKLLNANADISSELMNDISGLKKLVGEDTMRAEYKGGKVFSFKPYAKLLFSANRIPESRDDKTNAYYRRMIILDVNRRCQEIPHLSDRLKEESAAGVFFHMAVDAVANMYMSDTAIKRSERSMAAVQQLYEAGDSVIAFLQTAMIKDPNARESRETLYELYRIYCWTNDRTPKTKNGFYENMRDKGFREVKSSGIRFFEGIRNEFNLFAVQGAYKAGTTIPWDKFTSEKT